MDCCGYGKLVKTDIGYVCVNCDSLVDELEFDCEIKRSSFSNQKRNKYEEAVYGYNFPWYVRQVLLDAYESVEWYWSRSGRSNMVNRHQLICEILKYADYGQYCDRVKVLKTRKGVEKVRDFVREMFGTGLSSGCVRLEEMEFLTPVVGDVSNPKLIDDHTYRDFTRRKVKICLNRKLKTVIKL